MAMGYRVARVREVRGRSAVWYQPGGALVVERFYIKEAERCACLQHRRDARAPSAPPQRRAGHSPRKREKESAGARGAPTLENRTRAEEP